MYIKYVHNILKRIKKKNFFFYVFYRCSGPQYCYRISADGRFQMIVKNNYYCKIIIFGANHATKKSKYKVVARKCFSILDEIRMNHVFETSTSVELSFVVICRCGRR